MLQKEWNLVVREIVFSKLSETEMILYKHRKILTKKFFLLQE